MGLYPEWRFGPLPLGKIADEITAVIALAECFIEMVTLAA
jgi:hypothetical protein